MEVITGFCLSHLTNRMRVRNLLSFKEGPLHYLKVTVHLQTDHFVEILIFRLMYWSKHELSSKKKNSQKY